MQRQSQIESGLQRVPFLSPEADELLENKRQQSRELDSINLADIRFSQIGSLLMNVYRSFSSVTEAQTYVADQDEWIASIDDPVTRNDEILPLQAVSVIYSDLALSTSLKMVTKATAVSVAEGDYETAEKGGSVGVQLILGRARFATSAMMGAMSYLYQTWPKVDGESNTWDKATHVYASTHLKEPVRLDGPGDETYYRLINEVDDGATTDDPRISTSKFINVIRNAKRLRESTKKLPRRGLVSNPNAWLFTSLYNHIENEVFPVDFDTALDPESIKSTMQTATKVRRYIDGAAVLDKSLVKDQRARYVAFLGQHLTAYDVEKEVKNFNKEAGRQANLINDPQVQVIYSQDWLPGIEYPS